MRGEYDLEDILSNPNYPLSAGRTDIRPTIQYDLNYPLPGEGGIGAHLAYRRGDPEWASLRAGHSDWLQVCSVQDGGRLCFWSFTVYFGETGSISEVRIGGDGGRLSAFAEVPDVFAQLADCLTVGNVEAMLRAYGVQAEQVDR